MSCADKAGEGAGVEDNGPDAKKDEDDYEADGNKVRGVAVERRR
jgi:hypothetical protein